MLSPSGTEDHQLASALVPLILCAHILLYLASSHFSLSLSTEKFLVKSPSQSIVAELGGNIILPCSLYPAMNAENMELRWFRTQISDVVFVYQNQQEQKEEQMPQYAGRTSMVKDLLTSGEAAVLIDKVQVSDDGLYTCLFKKGGYHSTATLELKVSGMGSVPEVKIQGPEEDGVQVVCMSSGWFPKPLVQWRDLSGKKFLVFSEVHAQDTEGLFQVEASLVVRDMTSGNVTCSIHNPVSGQEKAKAIFIPAWRKAQLYADWRKEQFQAWSVTLDPCSAHPELAFSQENRTLTWKYISKNSDYKKCSVLGLQGISSGRYYWEIEVNNGMEGTWTVGVCREDVARGDFFIECPERGFWAVGQHLTEVYVCTSPEKKLALRQIPWRVGVFLDYDGEDLSFYNMIDGSYIFSFSNVSSSGTLFPYFMFESYRVRTEMSLTICTMARELESLLRGLGPGFPGPQVAEDPRMRRSGTILALRPADR
ncbi:PREDICTED: butyrophilin subfamily 1 member A1-like [Elephantulus edwardii]|uniref:butyrophilin subfamily 1 member A1-like n=1 Tax=Elephantulus edwardii TaxID=28737 RepID=UPI0003F0D52F|nr:PREDICTED: butyrophilin subfamily 1 member A1-like [Elephantulus edwardii]